MVGVHSKQAGIEDQKYIIHQKSMLNSSQQVYFGDQDERNQYPLLRDSFLRFKQLLKCRICAFELQDPHTITECGHTFCRDCIHPQLGRECKCPVCFIPARIKNLKRNLTLINIIDISRDLDNQLQWEPRSQLSSSKKQRI